VEVSHGLHATRGTAALSSIVLGQLPIVLAVVHPHSLYTTAAGDTQATTVVHSSGVPLLQLWKGWALCQGLPSAKAGQLTAYSNASGEPVEEPVERPSTVVWPRQLHNH
jgi:hypothetical protein